MKNINITLIAAALLSVSSVYADDMQGMTTRKSCTTIATACTDAGYNQTDTNKPFWQACMKPLILGKTVDGVTIEAGVAKACRTDKISELKSELKELQKVSTK